MTDILVPTTRYLWLVASLTDVTEIERLGEEYEHFTNYDLTDANDETVTAVELSRDGLEYKSMSFRDPGLEMTRAFSFWCSKHGAEYWSGVMRKYIDIRQAATAARIQAMQAASKMVKADNDSALKVLAEDIDAAKERVELERARIEAEEKATLVREAEKEFDSRRGATINKNGTEGFE
jgi:hypothetical protein